MDAYQGWFGGGAEAATRGAGEEAGAAVEPRGRC